MAGFQPMYFLKLEVENVRCFRGEQVLDLADPTGNAARWSVILGDNGAGKTTLLHCLTWMRPAEAPPPKGENGEPIKIDGVQLKPILDDQENSRYRWFFGNDPNETITMRVEYQVGRLLDAEGGGDAREVRFGTQIVREDGKLKDVEIEVGILPQFCEPNLFAYSAGRHMTERNTDRPELKDPVFNLTSDVGELYDAEQVLNDLNYKALIEESKQVPNPLAKEFLQRVKEMLFDLLPDLPSPDAIQIEGPRSVGSEKEQGGVFLLLPSGRIPLEGLSLGYKTMLAWAVDLAIRLFESNPLSPAPLKEPAIVLIDEIDLHLHPRWQREIRDLLLRHFPNTQFIVTAHSPLMAQAAEHDNLAALNSENGEVTIDNLRGSIDGLRVDQILVSELFNLPSARSRRIESQIEERRVLLDKPDRSAVENARLSELDELLRLPTRVDPREQADLDLIRRAAEKIKALQGND